MKSDFKNIFIYLLGLISLYFYWQYPVSQLSPLSTKLASLLHYHEYYNQTLSQDYGPYLAYHLHFLHQIEILGFALLSTVGILTIMIILNFIFNQRHKIAKVYCKNFFGLIGLGISILFFSAIMINLQQYSVILKMTYSIDLNSLIAPNVEVIYEKSTHSVDTFNGNFMEALLFISLLFIIIIALIMIINRSYKGTYAEFFMDKDSHKAKKYIEEYISNYEKNKLKLKNHLEIILTHPETSLVTNLYEIYMKTGEYEKAKLLYNKYKLKVSGQFFNNLDNKKVSLNQMILYFCLSGTAILFVYMLFLDDFNYFEIMYSGFGIEINNFILENSTFDFIYETMNSYSHKMEIEMSFIDSILFYSYLGCIGLLSAFVIISYITNLYKIKFKLQNQRTNKYNYIKICVKLPYLCEQLSLIVIAILFSILLTANFIFYSHHFIAFMILNLTVFFCIMQIMNATHLGDQSLWFILVRIYGILLAISFSTIILSLKLKYIVSSELHYLYGYENFGLNFIYDHRVFPVIESKLMETSTIGFLILFFNLLIYFSLFRSVTSKFIVRDLINIAEFQHNKNNYGNSHLFYKNIEQEYSSKFQSLKLSSLEILSVYENLTYSSLQLDNFSEGKKYATIFFELASKYGFKEAISRAHYFIGYIEEQNENYEEAFTNYDNSIGIIELVRKDILKSENRQKYFEDKAQAYEQMVLLCIKLGKIDDAFEYVERSKSRAFVDMLSNKELWTGDIDEKLLKTKKEIVEKMHELTRKLSKEQSITSERSMELEDSPILELGEELKSAELNHSEILAKIREQNPEYGSLFDTYMLPLNQIKDITRTNGVAILEYYITKDSVLAFFIVNETIICENLDVKPDKLNELYTQLRTKTNKFSDKRKFNEISKNIYDLIMKPIENNIPEYTDLCIVPHGFLHLLPFNSLFDGSNYLIEKYKIFYSPSSTVLNFCIEKDINPRDSCLSIGNPTHNLNYAEMEAEGVSDLFTTSLKLIGDNATKESVVSQCGNYNVLHMACHGYFVKEYPLSSGLKLANGKDLYAGEIFELNLNQSSIVILSACQTALSNISTGDELVGMIRAFMFAGAPSVMATMWEVDDEMTGELVKDFCIGFREKTRVNALKDAQMKFINGEYGEKYKHPYYWAAFEIIGSY